MKGLIFQTYIDFLIKSHGEELKNFILRDAGSGDRDSYEAMGTYPFKSLYGVVAQTNGSYRRFSAKILEDYGYYLFDILAVSYAKYLVKELICSASWNRLRITYMYM